MGGIAFLFRITLAAAAFLFLVVVWAILPYNTPEEPLSAPITSVFLGTAIPQTPVRELLLAARFFFGLGVTFYIFLPSLGFFFEFHHERWNRPLAEIMAVLAVLSYLGALVAHFVFGI